MDHPCGRNVLAGHVTIVSHDWSTWRGVPFDSLERICRSCGKIEIKMLEKDGGKVRAKKTKKEKSYLKTSGKSR